MKLLKFLIAVAGPLLNAGIVSAHAFWVVPFDGAADIGERVVFDLRIGPEWPGEAIVRETGDLIDRFDITDGQGTRPVPGREGSRPVGHYTPVTAGTNIAVMTSYPRIISLSGEDFDGYLAEEGLTQASELRASLGLSGSPARERFRRNVKTLVFVGGDSDGYDRRMSLPLELIPITDPMQHHPGSEFSLRLLRDGEPLAGARVTALTRDDPGRKMMQRTAADGTIRLKLPIGGIWMFYAVDIKASSDPDLDWESTWTSLTFKLGSQKED